MSTPGRTSVGRYELRERLGVGGMGTVWHAWDPALQRDVAVKEVLLPDGMTPEDRAEAHARTLREAQATARISHTAVVTIHDVLEHDGSPWIVMELLSGSTLQQHVDVEGPMPVERVEQAARSLLGGLQAAHAAGVTHRDVKPANIMLTEDDRTVLMDFGIANVDGSAALTQTGVYIGSPEYMAPERFEGERALPASDLWSLGVTLYSLLEGRSPFKRDSITGMISAVLTAPMPPQLVRNEAAEAPKSLALRALIGVLLTRDLMARPSPQEALDLLERERQAAQKHMETRKASLPHFGAAGGGRDGGQAADEPGPGTSGKAGAVGANGAAGVPVVNTPSPYGGTPARGQQPQSRVQQARTGPPKQSTAPPKRPAAPPKQPTAPPPRRQHQRQQPSGPQVGGYSRTVPPATMPGRAVRTVGPETGSPVARAGPGAGHGAGPSTGGAPQTDAGARFLQGVGHTGTDPEAPPALPGIGRSAKPDMDRPSSVVTAMVMLGLNALALFVFTALSAGLVDDPASATTWGNVVFLGLWGVLSAFAAFGLLTRSRLVFALVAAVQGIASVSLATSMFTVFVYAPELMVIYALMLLYTLGIGGLLLVPSKSRAYFGLG